MYWRLAGIVVFVCFCFFGVAQEQKKNDTFTVYHNSGSIFVGSYQGASDNQLRLRLATGDTISILIENIERMRSDLRWSSKQRFHFTEGVYMFSSFGAGARSNAEVASQALFTLAMRIDEKTSAGLGLGIAYFDAQLASSWAFNVTSPMYVYGRRYLYGERRKVYAETMLGYGRGHDGGAGNIEHSGGLFFQPGVGVHFASKGRLKWHVFMRQAVFHTNGVSAGNDFMGNRVQTSYSLWYNRTVFGFGFELF